MTTEGSRHCQCVMSLSSVQTFEKNLSDITYQDSQLVFYRNLTTGRNKGQVPAQVLSRICIEWNHGLAGSLQVHCLTAIMYSGPCHSSQPPVPADYRVQHIAGDTVAIWEDQCYGR
jgi:hypothetical protein